MWHQKANRPLPQHWTSVVLRGAGITSFVCAAAMLAFVIGSLRDDAPVRTVASGGLLSVVFALLGVALQAFALLVDCTLYNVRLARRHAPPDEDEGGAYLARPILAAASHSGSPPWISGEARRWAGAFLIGAGLGFVVPYVQSEAGWRPEFSWGVAMLGASLFAGGLRLRDTRWSSAILFDLLIYVVLAWAVFERVRMGFI